MKLRGFVQCDPSLPPWSIGCHSDSKDPWGGEAPTFKAFLIHDNGVVLRGLCQTEELTSEQEEEGKRREGGSD